MLSMGHGDCTWKLDLNLFKGTGACYFVIHQFFTPKVTWAPIHIYYKTRMPPRTLA
jgi:hypothetical protein